MKPRVVLERDPVAVTSSALIELRLVQDAPLAASRSSHAGETPYIVGEPLMSDPDLKAVRTFLRTDELVLDIEVYGGDSLADADGWRDVHGDRKRCPCDDRAMIAP